MIIVGDGDFMRIISIDNFDVDVKRLNEKQRTVCEFLLKFFEDIENGYKECTISFLKIRNNLEVKLYFAPFNISSYEMTIYISDIAILIELDGWHENFYYDKVNLIGNFLKELRDFLIFVLSDACKLLIFKSNNKSYKWNLLSTKENKLISSTGLLFYNFFGKKSVLEKKVTLFKNCSLNSASVFFQKYV